MWIDSNRTLIMERNRDTWQMPLIDACGSVVGHVVGQIVEPKEYMVRYFLVYDPNSERRFLLPSELVVNIENEIYCEVQPSQIAALPEYEQNLERDLETQIYQIIERTPYWEESLEP